MTKAKVAYTRILLKLSGEAIHPIMDSSSPEHSDTNGNPKEWSGVVDSYIDGQRHSPTDFIGNETSENLTPEIHESQDQRLNDAYDKVFGNKE